jgi:hypothetical protein
MIFFIIPLGLFDCQLDIAVKRATQVRDEVSANCHHPRNHDGRRIREKRCP